MGFYKNEGIAEQGNRTYARKQNKFKQERYPLDVTIECTGGQTSQHIREQDEKAVTEFNSSIRAWGDMVNEQLRSSISSLMTEKENLLSSLKQNYRHFGKAVHKGQEITSIGFRFKEEGIFMHLGVGRGYNMEGTVRVITKKNDSQWKRNPVKWFNPVIEKNIPALEEILKQYSSDLFVNSTKIMINR